MRATAFRVQGQTHPTYLAVRLWPDSATPRSSQLTVMEATQSGSGWLIPHASHVAAFPVNRGSRHLLGRMIKPFARRVYFAGTAPAGCQVSKPGPAEFLCNETERLPVRRPTKRPTLFTLRPFDDSRACLKRLTEVTGIRLGRLDHNRAMGSRAGSRLRKDYQDPALGHHVAEDLPLFSGRQRAHMMSPTILI